MTRSWRKLAEYSVRPAANNERLAADRVAQAIETLGLPPERLDRLKTAVAVAVLNARERTPQPQASLSITIRVLASAEARPRPRWTARPAAKPQTGPETKGSPIDAELPEVGVPRAWSFFLLERMEPYGHDASESARLIIELFLYLEGSQ